MSIKNINSITTSKHSWPDYGAKMKDKPNMRHGPDHPNWAPLLIIRERHIVSLRVLVELPLRTEVILAFPGSFTVRMV